MKKKVLSFVLMVMFVFPFSLMLTGCFGESITYLSVMPEVYEADLTIVNDYDTYNYSVIKRTETIEGNDYLIIYDKYSTKNYPSLNQEWLRIWNNSTQFWDDYLWNEQTSKWEKGTVSNVFSEVNYRATYINGVELKKSDLVKETSEYLEYTWGGKYPDALRISNNEYHICLYHAYNNKGKITGYDEFTKFTYNESATPIPHISNFTFASE